MKEWREVKEDRIYEIKLQHIKITVHKYFNSTNWFYSCNNVGLKNVILDTTDLEEAKGQAVLAVRLKLIKMLEELEGIQDGK